MSKPLPLLIVTEADIILQSLGFDKHAGKDYNLYIHPHGKCTSLPSEPNQTISPVLLRRIVTDCGFSEHEFVQFRCTKVL
ncbi:MAG: hypothetical protein R8K21_06515 [Mariprofundales bacterium]